tara:strand:- start:438 stop:650 length:213 start_codon:yes stop_codon:yes gene_type:complete
METEKQFQTSSYQRRAYNAYLARNKDNQEFQEKRREAQRKYYHTHKVKVLAKLHIKRAEEKARKMLELSC